MVRVNYSHPGVYCPNFFLSHPWSHTSWVDRSQATIFLHCSTSPPCLGCLPWVCDLERLLAFRCDQNCWKSRESGHFDKTDQKKVENDNFNEKALATWLSACYPGGVCESFRATVQAFIHSLNARVKNHQWYGFWTCWCFMCKLEDCLNAAVEKLGPQNEKHVSPCHGRICWQRWVPTSFTVVCSFVGGLVPCPIVGLWCGYTKVS